MTVTIEAIQAKQNELAAMIEQFATAHSKERQIKLPGGVLTLQEGERYAGERLDENGNHLHHVIVMAARPTGKLNWKDAQAWAKEQGGDVASPEEYALIKANCPDLLTAGTWYWSNREHKDDASYAWYVYSGGDTFNFHKSFEGSALAVRRA